MSAPKPALRLKNFTTTTVQRPEKSHSITKDYTQKRLWVLLMNSILNAKLKVMSN